MTMMLNIAAVAASILLGLLCTSYSQGNRDHTLYRAYTAPSRSLNKPIITMNISGPLTGIVLAGDTIRLTCSVTSLKQRSVRITWSKEGKSFPVGRTSDDGKGHFEIINATVSDSGTYFCTAVHKELTVGGNVSVIVEASNCEDVCADEKPTVNKNGTILMTIWYDNDKKGDEDQQNAQMALKACKAIDYFQDKFFVEFVIGAGSKVNDKNELECKHDCEEERLEGCAAMLLDYSKFPNFVCCNNAGNSARSCAEKLGVQSTILDDCVDNNKSDQFLISNGNRRRRAGIPECHLPEFSFNGVVDRCKKISTSEELNAAICEIFERGGISIRKCSG